jgi:hypothetical protein
MAQGAPGEEARRKDRSEAEPPVAFGKEEKVVNSDNVEEATGTVE